LNKSPKLQIWPQKDKLATLDNSCAKLVQKFLVSSYESIMVICGKIFNNLIQ